MGALSNPELSNPGLSNPGLSFPRLLARTRGFTLGRPRQFAIAGDRVTFVRSASGTDPLALLWVLDADGSERLLVDPRKVLGDAGEELSTEERARRERSRETGSGVVAYAVDDGGRMVAFSLSGRLFLADIATGNTTELPCAGAVIDPRPDPSGTLVAYVADGGLHVAGPDFPDRVVAAEPGVTWGLAEFVAAEEMGRDRGYWWAAGGDKLLACRVDEQPVERWWIADPAQPNRPPRQVRYPAAGTPNADVQVAVLGLDGAKVMVDWDRNALPYVVTAGWNDRWPWLVVMSRDQRNQELRRVDAADGSTTTIAVEEDPTWIEVVPGVPRWTKDGRAVRTVDDADTRRLVIGESVVTPPGLQVTRVVHARSTVIFTATEEPTERHVYRVDPDRGDLKRLTSEPGVHDAVATDDLLLVTTASMTSDSVTTTVRRLDAPDRSSIGVASVAEIPPLAPAVTLLRSGERGLRTALVLPRQEVRREGPLPVLVDPYGGPHAQRVLATRGAYLQAQWFADQGFAVVICDGRGTPARGPAWERAVHLDLAGPVLADQIDALQDVAERYPDLLDLDRVAIRGWSFGGYLAALAVLRRPDVFHAAIAGAPVTDFRLYDTFYSERYLGRPDIDPDPYERCSLIASADELQRPLLLIHGLADDNVVVAHTLQFSTALLTAGRSHSVLPLSGITHMTPQETVAENLLVLQARFLTGALAL